MSFLSLEVLQNRLLVCVQWGDGVTEEDWNELGDALLHSRKPDGPLPVLIVTEGRGATESQLKRMRKRLEGKQRVVFMTRSSAAIEAAHAIESPDVHVDVVRPGDFGNALECLRVPHSLLTPVVVTVARLARETPPVLRTSLPSHVGPATLRMMHRLE